MRKKMRIGFIVCLIFLCRCISSPEEECHISEAEHISFTDQEKEYIEFSIGSYWVMRDSANHNEIDTILVVDTMFYDTSFLEGDDYCYILPIRFTFYENEKVFPSKKIREQAFKEPHTISYSFDFCAGCNFGSGIESDEQDLKIDDIISSSIKSYSYSNRDTEFIIFKSPTIGIVKVVNSDSNTTWELIKYFKNEK